MLNRQQIAAATFCVALILAVSARSANIRVSPITLDFAAGRHAGTLTVSNASDHPATVQLRIVRWTAVDGDDRLTPTDDVVASPPVATLPAKGDQLVRIVRVRPGPADAEEAYRVLVDEIPDAGAQRPGEVLLVMRQSLPVFFNDGAPPKPDLSWRVEPGTAGGRLVAQNVGGRRVRISELQVRDRTGAVVYALPGLAGYVLAGASHAWRLPAGDDVRAATVTADTDQGPIDAGLAPAG